jgi:hypothetical protein
LSGVGDGLLWDLPNNASCVEKINIAGTGGADLGTKGGQTKAPSSNLQAPEKFQASSSNESVADGNLIIGA